jgi:hypothetical protein
VLAPSGAAAASLRATGVASAGAHRVCELGDQALTPGPDSLRITIGAAAADTVLTKTVEFTIQADADAIGVARYGSLAGRSPAAASALAASPYLATAFGSAIVGFDDAGEVVSNTLAPGTPVTLTFRMTLAATAMHVIDGPVPTWPLS